MRINYVLHLDERQLNLPPPPPLLLIKTSLKPDVTLGVSCSLNETHKQIAYVLCQCIFDGDMALMRRYIKAGVDIDIGDYDQRTALHIAAAEVNLPAVGILPFNLPLPLPLPLPPLLTLPLPLPAPLPLPPPLPLPLTPPWSLPSPLPLPSSLPLHMSIAWHVLPGCIAACSTLPSGP